MNATQAAIRAGYAPKNADVQAHQILSIPKVKIYLQKIKAEQSKRTGITADLVLKEMAAIGFAKITDVIDEADEDRPIKKNLREDTKAAISSISVRRQVNEYGKATSFSVKMHDKRAALKDLGQYFGLYNDFNMALATLSQYGDVETAEDGSYVFRPSGGRKTEITQGEDEVSAEE